MHINHSVLKNQRLPLIFFFFTWLQSVIGFIGDGQLSYIFFSSSTEDVHIAQILNKISGSYFINEDGN